MENEKLDIGILNEMYEKGLLHKQFHPTYPLIIWNYSPLVQYEKLWTPLLMMCRGLVTDFDGNIKARSFPKFFNYEEHKPEEIPNEDYIVYEKMDGSLGILFNYENEWIMATRGSFTSQQAIKGKEILNKHDISPLRKDNTYLFEIIYPENRIVVDYGNEEKLVVLGVIHTETGDEVPHNALYTMSGLGFEIVTTYKTWGEGYDLLKEEISKDKEGYVIRFQNGFRMKIKGDEYCRLHKILTNFSTTDIWELMRTKESFDKFLEKVPDEFYDWVKSVQTDLTNKYNDIKERAEKFVNDYKDGCFPSQLPLDKKYFASLVMQQQIELRPVMFAMYDNKSFDHIIWKMIKPKWTKPFKKDEN